MFVDYVRVYQTTGASLVSLSMLSATIFPNPYDGTSNLKMDVTDAGMV